MTSGSQHRGSAPADRVRDGWARAEAAFAAWSTLADPVVAEAVAASGVDAVVVDLQHGYADAGTLPVLCRAITRGGAAPMVRVAWPRPELIMRALDAGADTVIVPMIETAAEAERAARACRYPPRGDRSWGRLVLPGDPGAAAGADELNDRVRCLIMIETRSAVADLDNILAATGVDGIFIGPYDLALACGHAGRTYRDSADVDRLIGGIVTRARDAGRVVGLYGSDAEMAADWVGRGVQLATIGQDIGLLCSAARTAVAAARGATAER